MNRGRRSVTFCLCAGVLVVAAACGSGPTPEDVRPSSVPTSASTSASPLPTTTVEPSPSVLPSPTANLTGKPGKTPLPTPTPDTRPGAVCSGGTQNISFWTQAASWLPFDTYCAVLPKGWFLSAATYDSHNGGILNAAYAGPSGAWLQLKEGKFCTTSADACSPHDAVIGPASFGDRPGTLYSLVGGGFAVYVSPGSVPAWQIVGTKLTRDAFVALAASLAKIRKS